MSFRRFKRKVKSRFHKIKSFFKRIGKSLFKVFIILVILALLGAAGYLGYKLLMKPSNGNNNTSSASISSSGTVSKTVQTTGDFKINLPPTIYGVVGREMNIYFDNILYSKKENYNFDVVCGAGAQQNERWTYFPRIKGTYTFNINVYKEDTLLGTATSNIIITPASAGEGLTKNLLFIGDYTTMTGAYTGELVNIQTEDVMKLSLIGTQGSDTNLFEGYNDATIEWYYSNPLSPFASGGQFDFSNYITINGLTSPDYVFINLGINDVFNFSDDESLNTQISNALSKLDSMILNIQAYNPGIKIGIMVTIPPSLNQDGFGYAYLDGQTGFRYKRNNSLWVTQLIEHYKGKESEKVYLVPVNVNLDTENNMQNEVIQVNGRNPLNIIRQSSGLYPSDYGYQQIADSVFSFLKSLET